jgi:2-polyprenyl-6-methoxyphenol hydroxylase-like FAD-dependent oxidoreductase
MANGTSSGANHAVVIGASMGGLLAARVLADFFDRVTIVDRDTLPDSAAPRHGVPQGRHTHALLPSGRVILEELFPGLTAELVAQGAPLGDPARDLRWFEGGGYHCPFDSTEGITALLVSRPRLEAYVRQRLCSGSTVCVIDRCDALGPAMPANRSAVSGLRIRRRAPGCGDEVLDTSLVVDASGRASRAKLWLEELGYEPPPVEQVRVDLGYMTRLYRRRPGDLDGMKAVVIATDPGTNRGGVMLAQEDDRWTVTLAGFSGCHPPADESGFVAFARTLPAPDIHEVIGRAEPLCDPFPYRYEASTRRRYERLGRCPDGFLVFGDAICSFNPIYGQGMSVAALQAVALRRALAAGPRDLARRFYRQAARIVDNPWQIVAGGDLRFPGTAGKRTPDMRVVNWYLGKVHVAARREPAVARAFNHVASLLAPPSSLLRPATIARVLRGNLRAGHS